MTDTFFDLFGAALAFFYDNIWANYGFIIVALTLCVMLITTPLTLKATRSMMMMQQLQPEMKKLQSKYKDDRQKLNEELLKFYKENNISPVGGCLPLLIQMPVFFILYAVLRGLTLRVPVLGSNWGSVLGQQAANIAPLQNPPEVSIYHNFQPEYVPQDSQLYTSLSNTNVMNFFGMDLAQSATEVYGHKGLVAAIPYAILIVIVGATSFIQQRQIQGRNPNAAQINPQQQQIMKIMPIFLPLISFGLPSGLVLYFAVSNLYRVGQQWFIGRTIYGHTRGGAGETAAKDPVTGKGGTKAVAAKTATKAGATKAVTKGGAKTAGAGKATGAKGTSRTVAKQPAKGAAKPAANSDRNGAKATDDTGDASPAKKPRPSPRSGARGGGGSGNGASDRSPRTSDGGSAGSDAGGPTLQPRARKNKKR